MFLPLLLALTLLQQPIHDEPLTLPQIVYPPTARQQHIQGTVHLEIAVDSTGHVFGVRAIDGPEPLRAAAIEAYRQATYKPLLAANGRPAPAVITTEVDFHLDELPPDTDQLVDRDFQPQQAACQQLSSQKSPAALTTCRQAVLTSHHFTPQANLESRATSLNDLVLLLIAPGKASPDLPEAATLAQEAVELVATSSPHTPAVAIAYITRAEVRSLQGDLPGTEADCTVAEEALTTTLHDAPETERAGRYRVQLRETLLLHALILDRDHKKAEAKRLRAQSATL